MDPRIREHAEVLVDDCAEIAAGDQVVIVAHHTAEDLVVAVAELVGERGGIIHHSLGSSRARRAHKLAADEETLDQQNEIALAAYEAADAVVQIRGEQNLNETGDVPPEKNAVAKRANMAVQEALLDSRWVLTQWPSTGYAQKAEMSTEAYEEFVWNAVNKDWDAVREHQAQLVELLDPADEVRIVSGDTTDVRMSVAGNHAKNDADDNNMPGGEVFTAPVVDSVEGEVLFDKPVLIQGREVLDVRLVFEDGEVVEHEATKNEDLLTSLLETDEGSSRLGELGIGMNRDIDRFTYNMLFDEKMGDTVHMAIGRGYEETVGEDNERNESTVHEDMIVDMSEDSRIEFDGEVVQRDGTFGFEESFDG
ncbi:aminopeptidase [Haloglomus halophilum]|uniref:aminopeptidase n=1 Tax=Haloglomus halophilum TaxID=2962672 RepID=UPI0020C98505|nr:aminopeptidase [Haloglomus halophilum]